ncbi:glycosyltransferase [Melioribacteraceae bacterium 4301-Me]|uniref:glycosyltransferase n=1 Tax=Pyranulibacter aquaticus TaxID=3163344 RepID=UPI00359982B9
MEMKIALVHDWLTGMRGGEKVLEVLCELYPQATLITLLHNKGSLSSTIEKMSIKTSFIDRLPFKEKKYRNYLPLFPLAIESIDFSEFDLIISSSHAVAKAAKPNKNALHICYCHTPMRYIWDMYDDYFGKGKANFFVRKAMKLILPKLRQWDVRTSNHVHYFIANSKNVAERIKKYYQRQADVIYPPVDTSLFSLSNKCEDYFLIVSALVPYKRIDIAIEAFNKIGEKLVVVGTGPEADKLKAIAKKNIEFLGWCNNEQLAKIYSGCKALIFPGLEDFGIVPLEAMATGKPVIAFAKGGALETIIGEGENSTGIFFYEQTSDALINAVKIFDKKYFDPQRIRQHALQFDRSLFKEKLKNYIEEKIAIHLKAK